jgi:hypothetical protein
MADMRHSSLSEIPHRVITFRRQPIGNSILTVGASPTESQKYEKTKQIVPFFQNFFFSNEFFSLFEDLKKDLKTVHVN